MKIAIFDPYMPKFSQDMVDWWQAHGHEVRRERYYNPALVDWADVVWFETCDNNLQVASHGMPDHPDWPLVLREGSGTKRVVVRIIDIEAWYGHHMNADWNMVDDVIFLAPHIKELVEKDIDFRATNTRVHVIPCGVNMQKFPLVDKEEMDRKIAWVCEKWPTKGIDYALQIMAALPEGYELHALGPWNDRYAWEKAYQEDFIKRNRIAFFDYEWVDNLAEWLADKDFILSCSKKEGFGYSIAEGMATGLKPVIHNFYGADWLWGKTGCTWDTIEEAVELIDDVPESGQTYREMLVSLGYTLDRMMERFDSILHG